MYSLFNRSTSAPGKLSYPRLAYYRNQLFASLERVQAYYRQHHTRLDNQHPLRRLIHNLPLSLEMEEHSYHDLIADRVNQISRVLNFTTVGQSAPVLTGVFTHTNNSEIVIALSGQYTPEDYQNTQWRSLSPLRFVRHPFTDFAMALPDGRMTSTESGVVVVLIDIPMLMCQYRRWVQHQLQQLGDEAHDSDWFITTVLYPNLLSSQLDVAFINRVMATYRGQPVSDLEEDHPFYINQYYREIDQQIDRLIVKLNRQPQDWEDLLADLPAITGKDWQSVVELPEILVTRQVRWALVVARLPLMEWLGLYDQVTGSRRNLTTYATVLRTLRRLENDREFDRRLPDDVLDAVTEQMDNLDSLLR